jgi:hypothetical protein
LNHLNVWLGSLLLLVVSAPAMDADSIVTAEKAARAFANCMLTMNSDCVILSSDIDAYVRLARQRQATSDPDLQFAEVQERLFYAMKENGRHYLQWEVAGPRNLFSVNGIQYVFVPYQQVTRSPDGDSTVRSSLIGISKDNGSSWKFVDGHSMTLVDLKAVIPGYSGSPPFPL